MATKKKTAAKKKASSHAKAGIAELAKKMRGIDFCMMSTISTGGAIRARPMSNNGEVEFDGDAWFFSWKDSQKVRDIAKSSHVSLDYTGGKKRNPLWIHVDGRARIVTDAKKKKELWLKELERWFEDGPLDPEVVLIHVRATRAEWWSFEEQGDIRL